MLSRDLHYVRNISGEINNSMFHCNIGLHIPILNLLEIAEKWAEGF